MPGFNLPAPTILAQTGGFTLTDHDVLPAMGVVTLIIGRVPTAPDLQEVTGVALGYFHQHPQWTKQMLQNFATDLAMASTMNAMGLSQRRDELLSIIYNDGWNGGKPRGFLPVILRYITILKFDWSSRLAFTRADGEGLLTAVELAAAAIGQPIQRSLARDESFFERAAFRFQTCQREDKRFLSGGEFLGMALSRVASVFPSDQVPGLWANLQRVLGKEIELCYRHAAPPVRMWLDAEMSDAEREERARTGELTNAGIRPVGGAKPASSNAAHYNAVSDALRSNHAVTMNVISGTSGDGFYWSQD